MPVRNAEATWNGGLKDGKGSVKLGSGAYEGQYSFSSRFESGTGTNPEELVAAAHAGCYSMALSAGLGKAGFSPRRVHTTAAVSLEKVGEGFKITESSSSPKQRCRASTRRSFRRSPRQPRAVVPFRRHSRRRRLSWKPNSCEHFVGSASADGGCYRVR